MITAIAIPLLFLYFYYLTRKEQKRFREQWLQIGNVPAESLLKGTVLGVQEKTERYYDRYYIYIMDVMLQCGDQKVTARMQWPLTGEMEKPSFQAGETIVCYGAWDGRLFLFSTYEAAPTVSKNAAYNSAPTPRRQDA